MKQDIFAYLSHNSYPGRGILLGKSVNGEAIIAYFIMGRSESSRSRAFVMTNDGIRVAPLDADKLDDPSLLIYHPIREREDGRTVVTNGDQTETIMQALDRGEDWTAALRARTFEPDGPNWTPRISGVMQQDGSYMLSILKATDGDPASCSRSFFEYENPEPGTAHFISTYMGDGNPLPSFEGEPIFTSIPQATAADLAEALWNALDSDNRVSLCVRFANMNESTGTDMLINEYSGDIMREEGDVDEEEADDSDEGEAQ